MEPFFLTLCQTIQNYNQHFKNLQLSNIAALQYSNNAEPTRQNYLAHRMIKHNTKSNVIRTNKLGR